MSLSDLIHKGGYAGTEDIPPTTAEYDLIDRWVNTQGVYDPETMGMIRGKFGGRNPEIRRFIKLQVIMASENGTLPAKAICKFPEAEHEVSNYFETRITYDANDDFRNPATASPINRILHRERYSSLELDDLLLFSANHHGPAYFRVRQQADRLRILSGPLVTKAQMARYPDLDERWRELVGPTEIAMADEPHLRKKFGEQ